MTMAAFGTLTRKLRLLSRNFKLSPTKLEKKEMMFESHRRFGSSGIFMSQSSAYFTQYLTDISPREEIELEERIFNAIADTEVGVMDPILRQNIRTLGWIQSMEFSKPSAAFLDSSSSENREDPSLTINLSLSTLMNPNVKQIQDNLIRTVRENIINAMREKGIIDKSFEDESGIKINIKNSASKPKPFVRNVEEQDELIKKLGPGLSNVRHFLAVYSCKGGVGKSTIAANLAYELAQMGGRIGLIDVDVYGPSLPVLVKPDDPAVRKSTLGSGMVKPIEHEGVKMISLGFVSPTSGVPGSGPGSSAAVMRGPMAGRVVTQLLKGTEWGDLDVLILDMPPGTGDVQLTICQDLELSGAVAVTTPSKLAATDAAKGIAMFTSLGVPTVAVVENMSYFDCEGGNRHYPFGKSIKESSQMLQEADSQIQKSSIFQLPISCRTNEANDEGSPLCLSRPVEASDELSIFSKLSYTVAKYLLLLQHGRSDESASSSSEESMVQLDGQNFDIASLHMSVCDSSETFTIRLFSDSGAAEAIIAGEKLRNWHPKLGHAMDNDDDSADEIEKKDPVVITKTAGCGNHQHDHHHARSRLFPCRIEKKGRYGYSVEWGDKATIIYSMYSIARAAGATTTLK